MNKNEMKKTLAISGVIGGIVLLNGTTAYADENFYEYSGGAQEQNINSRAAKRGQVINVDGTYLRIRASASTDSEIVGTMTEGMTFDIISINNGWYEIKYNGVNGYVFGEYVDEINSSINENILYTGTVYDAEPNLRVRSGSSLNAAVIGYVVNNSNVSIVGIENDWYKIKYNESYGYVHSDYVSIEGNSANPGNEETNDDVEVDNSIDKIGYVYNLGGLNLRVRQSASTNSEILGSLYEGNEVNIIGEVSGWYKIKYNNAEGYVSSEYINLKSSSEDSSDNSVEDSSGNTSDNSSDVDNTPSNPDEVIINKGQVINVEDSNLRVRQSPSTDSLVSGYLLNNETVDIFGQEGNWYKIKFNNLVGYVSCNYVRVITDDSSTGENTSDETQQQNAYNIIYDAMMAQIGAPYVWGGSGEELTTSNLNSLKNRFPADTAAGEYDYAEKFVDQGYRAFDCSGLMYWSFAQADISIGRSTYDQINNGVEVSLSDVKPGDLIFTDDIGHVGMYVGDDKWIEAPYASNQIRVRNVPWDYVARARRILD